MADIVTYDNEVFIKLSLQDGTATTTRTLQVPNPKYAEVKAKARAFKALYIDGTTHPAVDGSFDYTTIFQPSNWRDEREDVDPYTTESGEFGYTSLETHILDLNT